jgi:hypothetical protein
MSDREIVEWASFAAYFALMVPPEGSDSGMLFFERMSSSAWRPAAELRPAGGARARLP